MIYEYKEMLLGEMGRGREAFRSTLNDEASNGWRYKGMIVHESDSYVLFEREIQPEPTDMAEETMDDDEATE